MNQTTRVATPQWQVASSAWRVCRGSRRPCTPAAGLSPARQFLNREKAGNEKALKALARSLQLDFGPIAEALQTFFDAPSQAEAQRLIERLPELLPDDPQSAVILEQAIAEAYGDAVQEDDEDVVVNKAEKCPECGRWLSASGACTDCAAADKAVAQGENPDSSEIKAAEIGKGKAAIKKCLETQKDIYDAFSRGDLGLIDIRWGNEKMGLCHIIKRRDDFAQNHPGALTGLDIAQKLPEVIIHGKIEHSERFKGRDKVVRYGDFLAILTLDKAKSKHKNHWILSGYQIDNEAAGYRTKKEK